MAVAGLYQSGRLPPPDAYTGAATAIAPLLPPPVAPGRARESAHLSGVHSPKPHQFAAGGRASPAAGARELP